jgi:hypothetical protein
MDMLLLPLIHITEQAIMSYFIISMCNSIVKEFWSSTWKKYIPQKKRADAGCAEGHVMTSEREREKLDACTIFFTPFTILDRSRPSRVPMASCLFIRFSWKIDQLFFLSPYRTVKRERDIEVEVEGKVEIQIWNIAVESML